MRNLRQQVAQPQDQHTTFIYTLTDPITMVVRYVGKANDPHKRLSDHLAPPHINAKSRKAHWLKKLVTQNLKPILNVLEFVDKSVWEEAERKWIAYYRSQPDGHLLTNIAPGGGGIGDGFKHKSETLLKMSVAHKGRTHTPEARVNISLHRMGIQYSEETRRKMSESKKALCASMTSEERKEKFGHRRKPAREISVKIIKPPKVVKIKQVGGVRQRTKHSNKSSQFIGVCWFKQTSRWIASVYFHGKSHHAGFFKEEIDAARARDRKAIELGGNTYRLNFSRSSYQ
jgi:hypothetical protein